MQNEYRVLVSGAIGFTDRDMIEDALIYAEASIPDNVDTMVMISNGRSRGLDVYSSRIALQRGWEIEDFRENKARTYTRDGRFRDETIVRHGVDLCLLFVEDGVGEDTYMVKLLQNTGVEIYVTVKDRNRRG